MGPPFNYIRISPLLLWRSAIRWRRLHQSCKRLRSATSGASLLNSKSLITASLMLSLIYMRRRSCWWSWVYWKQMLYLGCLLPLVNLPLPRLSDAHISSLNAPCSSDEISAIIASRRPTCPNPPTFSDDLLLANISLLPKPNKDQTLPQNFCPISIINNGLKLFGRLLADCLSKVLTSLISPDQTGYIPTRQKNR